MSHGHGAPGPDGVPEGGMSGAPAPGLQCNDSLPAGACADGKRVARPPAHNSFPYGAEAAPGGGKGGASEEEDDEEDADEEEDSRAVLISPRDGTGL